MSFRAHAGEEPAVRGLRDPRERMLLNAAAGCFVNLLYALYHGALGVAGLSLWLMTMCAYYAVLGVMRLSAVLCGNRADGRVRTEYFVMKLCGVLLMLLSVILAGGNYISASQDVAVKHGEIMMITIAAYTFYKITLSIVRAVRQHKTPSPLLAAIRGIGYAEASASVLNLQRSMLASFEGMGRAEIQLMNILLGSAVWVFVLILSAAMMIKGVKKG